VRLHIERVLDQVGGKIHGPGGAAELLGVNPNSLRSKMRKLGIPHYDVLPGLREKYQQDQVKMFFDHCHYTEEGNAFLGKKIADFLVEDVIKKK
jgi:hypothetical protein